MIRAYFGIETIPFRIDSIALLPHQQKILDILNVHCQQGGFCLVLGEPGTGKTVLKEALKQNASKNMIVPSLSRTLHGYSNTLKILCHAFQIDFQGSDFKCEKRLIEETSKLNRQGKMLVTIIDEAHLLNMNILRKLRLLFEEFPKNHNLILFGQTSFLQNLNLHIHEDIKSRVSFSSLIEKLNSDDIKKFILQQLDLAKLGHNTFSEEALELIARSSEGILRKTRVLCLSSLLEAVQQKKKQVSIKAVNQVLIQPHWRNQYEME